LSYGAIVTCRASPATVSLQFCSKRSSVRTALLPSACVLAPWRSSSCRTAHESRGRPIAHPAQRQPDLGRRAGAVGADVGAGHAGSRGVRPWTSSVNSFAARRRRWPCPRELPRLFACVPGRPRTQSRPRSGRGPSSSAAPWPTRFAASPPRPWPSGGASPRSRPCVAATLSGHPASSTGASKP